MELTTRCPECETAFPVSLEQLQLRKGYIRCIQCAHIFDGFEAALPADSPRSAAPAPREAPAVELTRPAARPPASPVAAPAPEDRPLHQGFIIPPADRFRIDSPQPARPFSIGEDHGSAASSAAPEPQSEHSIPTRSPFDEEDHNEPRIPSVLRKRGDLRTRSGQAGASFTISEPAAWAAAGRGEPEVGGGIEPDDSDSSMGERFLQEPMAETESAPDDYLFVEPRAGRRSERYKPEFLVDTERRRAWMTPVWAILTICGLVLLGVQGVYVYRSQLANSFPGLRPMLETACERLGCSVPYERRIEAIAITGSALRSSGPPDDEVSKLTLEVTLRNAYERPQEWPTLVLDLKDASGTVVVRRNLSPEVWVPASLNDGPFAAGSEIKVQLPVAVRGLQANGYQLDKFFP